LILPLHKEDRIHHDYIMIGDSGWVLGVYVGTGDNKGDNKGEELATTN